MERKKEVKGSRDIEMTFNAVDKFEKEERRRAFLEGLKRGRKENIKNDESENEKGD